VSDCEFDACAHGGVFVAYGSSASVTKTTFTSIAGACVHGRANATLSIAECQFTKGKGNGLVFESSHGFVRDSTFSDFKIPAIGVLGETADPTVFQCQVSDCELNAIVARDASAPIFRDLTVSRVQGDGFAISQASRAVVRDCVLSTIRGAYVAVCDGAMPTVQGNRKEDGTEIQSTIIESPAALFTAVRSS
jgi:hypothetical protein